MQYSLDPAPFERIREANYQFPIFQCQNPEGVIAGQDSVWLRWLFTPLEPQVYELDCPILVEHQGEKTPCRVIKFSAEGYHSKKIAPEELEAMQVWGQGFFRIIKNQGGGDPSPKTPSPPPQTKVTIVGKNEIYSRENLVRPFLVHQVLGPKPPPPLPPPCSKEALSGG